MKTIPPDFEEELEDNDTDENNYTDMVLYTYKTENDDNTINTEEFVLDRGDISVKDVFVFRRLLGQKHKVEEVFSLSQKDTIRC